MFEITLDIKPRASYAADLLRKLDRELAHSREPLEETVLRQMIPALDEHFEVSGQPPWEPLKDSTIERRRRAGIDDDRPLVATGRLARAVGFKARWTITNTTARFDNLPANARYGFVHQYGSDHMPARPWASVDREDADAAQKIFNRWIGVKVQINLSGWR